MTLYTAEEFCEMDLGDRRYELVRGVPQVRDSPVRGHGYIATMMAYAIRRYLDVNPIGEVVVEVGYTMERGPDTVRIPDVSFIISERLNQVPEWKFADVAPDLAIEVLSPSNRPKAIAQKVAEYLAKDARLVWIIDPKTRTVAVYAPDALPCRLGPGESLDGGDVLPEFRIEVEKIFRA